MPNQNEVKTNVIEKDLNTWDEFQKEVLSLRNEPMKVGVGHFSNLLFRGQGNATWNLETTLERWVRPNQSLYQYYLAISAAKAEIESRTNRKWNIPINPDYRKILRQHNILSMFPLVDEIYDYMVYLRHHGFPSPLLDWTRSPYIAAYFAFRSEHEEGRVAIFAYREYAGQAKGARGGHPRIVGLGPHVRTHERHFLQQSEYTVCFGELEHNTLGYFSHEDAFKANDHHQDLLWKFTLPGNLRSEVLQYLDIHNITAFSLFGTEDMLMETAAIREFVLQDVDLV